MSKPIIPWNAKACSASLLSYQHQALTPDQVIIARIEVNNQDERIRYCGLKSGE